MKHFLTLNSVLQGKSLPFFSTGNSSLQCWASPYFFNVPIYIGIHKWTLGYNSFLQFWNPISAWNKFFLWGESKTCWLCHSRKFHFQKLSQLFLWNLSGIGWLQLRERTRYWCRNQQGALSDQLLSPKRNCREIAAEELLGNCKVRKVFAKKKENGPDDESAHFGPAQEYERVSRRK